MSAMDVQIQKLVFILIRMIDMVISNVMMVVLFTIKNVVQVLSGIIVEKFVVARDIDHAVQFFLSL